MQSAVRTSRCAKSQPASAQYSSQYRVMVNHELEHFTAGCRDWEIYLQIGRQSVTQALSQSLICSGHVQDGESAKQLPCQHVYHAPCIDQWLVVSKVTQSYIPLPTFLSSGCTCIHYQMQSCLQHDKHLEPAGCLAWCGGTVKIFGESCDTNPDNRLLLCRLAHAAAQS